MRTFVYIATSLDGYIAKTDGNLDWLHEVPNPEHTDFGFKDFMEQIDAVLMGRKTFETAVSFDQWPYSKKVFVLSNTLTAIPEKLISKAELIKGEPDHLLEKLDSTGFKSVYIDGGKTIQSFLEKDLIDDVIVTRIPIILGNGIPLFATMKNELRFEHVKTEVYLNTLVKSHYKRIRK